MPKADLLRQATTKGPAPGFSRDLDANIDRLGRTLGYGTSYDIILRRLQVDGVDVGIFVINGFFESLMNLEVLRQIADAGQDRPVGTQRPPGARLEVLASLLQARLSYVQVSLVSDYDAAVLAVLSGPMLVLVDGEAGGIVVDTRAYPDRSPSAPETEQVLRGPQDGFVENLLYNTALIRRRVRDPGLRFELIKIGRRGQTDVAITYIEGLTNPGLIARVRRHLQSIDIDAIPMADEPVAELLGRRPWNPLPTSRMTERPDVAAINLYDGHVLVVIDTTPVVISVPTTLFQLLQHPEDYHVTPIFGTYLRGIEFYAVVWAVLIPPLWLLLATHPGVLARLPALSFIGPKKPPSIPLPVQFLLAEFSIDILRRAILNSPSPMATSFGILGAVVLGDVATKTGIFTPEALVYAVAAAIASFAVSNLELSMALRLVRITLIALEWLWALPGIVIGLLFWFVLALRTESLGVPYLWPLIPFSWTALRSVLIRESILVRGPRPRVFAPEDRWRRGS